VNDNANLKVFIYHYYFYKQATHEETWV